MNHNYILVTPVKNEGLCLQNTISSVVKQTVQPIIWVIANDGSTDNTQEIISEAAQLHPWIIGINLIESKWDLGIHLAEVVDEAVKIALEYCNYQNISYNYIGNLDGDLTIQIDFYEQLMSAFDKNPKLGVVSGSTFFIQNGCTIKENVDINEPSGGHILIRRKCFEECGGIIKSYSWDSAFKAKARLRSWDTKRIESAIATEVRPPSSSNGFWKGYVFHGESGYYRNLHPAHIFIKAIYITLKYPFYRGIAYLYGYFTGVIHKKNKIEDEELRQYYRSKLFMKIYSHKKE